jgi:hypothetical protein
MKSSKVTVIIILMNLLTVSSYCKPYHRKIANRNNDLNSEIKKPNVNQTYNTIAELRASNDYKNKYAIYFVSGYYSPNDGGGGMYRFDETSNNADDSAFYIRPDNINGPGRYVPIINDNEYNIKRFGAIGDGIKDNWWVFTKLFSLLPLNTSVTVTIPSGVYNCSKGLDINKPFNIKGLSLTSTLQFPGGVTGLTIHTNMHGYEPEYESFNLYCKSPDKKDGKPANGIYSKDPNDYTFHGIYCATIAKFKDIIIENFSGHGIRVYASVSDPIKTNASHAKFERVKVSGCLGAGVYISGPDANQIEFYGCDVRDCGLVGYWDASFLGNQFIACMAHNNGNTSGFGHYRVTNVNARTSIIACYGEGEDSRSYIGSGNAVVIGGIHYNGIYGPATIYNNASFNKLLVGSPLSGSNTSIGFISDVSQDKVSLIMNNRSGGSAAKLESVDSVNLHFSQSIGVYQNIWQLGSEGAMFSFGKYTRHLLFPAHGYQSLFIGNTFVQSAPSVNSSDLIPAMYHPGDIVYNLNYNGTNQEGWKCIQGGISGSNLSANRESRKGSTDGSAYVMLDGRTTSLKKGDVITFKNQSATILDMGINNKGQYYLLTDHNFPSDASLSAIDYSTVQWTAFGKASGTSAQHPKLTSNDKGFWYYNTTTDKNEYWNGSLWIAATVSNDDDKRNNNPKGQPGKGGDIIQSDINYNATTTKDHETLESGTYIPSINNIKNINSSKAFSCQYMRIGDVVTVSGKIDVTVLAIGKETKLEFSLPISTTFTGDNELAGTMALNNGNENGAVYANTINGNAKVVFKSINSGKRSCYFTFTYRVE